ncbi:hypothetical protein FOA52_008161 [Chlamydomonas sp. UWO 241]|nr:hypothetical protein FOA52_008161 [Chlamydomonas sp. UWO 241]
MSPSTSQGLLQSPRGHLLSDMGHAASRAQDAEEGRPLVSSKPSPGGQAKLDGPPRGSIVLPAIWYIFTSSALILLNKHALSSFGFTCPNSMLFFHCALAVGLVKGAEATESVQLEPLRWKVVTIWFPVNLLFVGMIATSYLALQRIGIGMFTLLKNMANLLTIIGDWYFFGKTYNLKVWGSLLLMMASAAVGSFTDLQFDMAGYTWQMINCVFTAGYALYLSNTMARVAPHTSNGERLSEFSMVFYNNFLSLGPVLVLMVFFGEFGKLQQQPALSNPEFLGVALAGGLLGFGISFSSLWFLSRSSATIYSLTGSINKILVAVLGILLFNERSSWQSALTTNATAADFHTPFLSN